MHPPNAPNEAGDAALEQAQRAILAASADTASFPEAVRGILREFEQQADLRFRRLSRLYAVASSVNEAIVRTRDPQALYDYACRIAVEQGDVKLAWIALRNDDGNLELAARCGGNEEFIARVMERIRSERVLPGPAGRTLLTGENNVANDIEHDATFYWKNDALRLGLRACGAFALKSAGEVKGMMTIYAEQPGYFGDEEVRALTALADDISFAVESAAREKTLADHQRVLATLFATLPGIAYRCRNDENWTALVLSDGCEVLTGYSKDELIGNFATCYERIIHPEDRASVRAAAEEGIAQRRPFEMVYRIVTAQGQQKWVWERGSGIFDAKGELQYLEGFITDITAQRQAETQVAAQAALLDKAKDAIVLCGVDDTVHYWNRGAERLYGWTATEAVGKKITTLTCRDTPGRRALLAQLASQGEWSGELTQFTKSGNEVPIEASWTLVRDERGQPASILAINTDITERRKLEAQFLTTQRLESIGTLAGGIAHDFNNILAAIAGNTKLAIGDLPIEHALHTPLREIEKATSRAGYLVRQILTFSRRQEVRRETIALKEVVADALRLLRATVPAQIEIHADHADPVCVAVDATQLHQVIVNLGTNAAFAMREHGGTLSIRLDRVTIEENARAAIGELAPGRYARLTVSDTGTGMDAATMARIFEPFFTTKSAGQGTGLGLSVVHGILQSHDGGIGVTSEPGRGTTFNVYLPALPDTTVPVKVSEPKSAELGAGQHVLYVDDEEALVFLTTRVLERLGYRVTGRTDAKQALGEFRDAPTRFDAVVSDLSMPGMTGPELAREVLSIRRDIPIVLTSGYIRDEDMKTVRELGICDLVLKPNTVEDLGAALHRVLSARP